MRPALDALINHVDREDARRALTDVVALGDLRSRLDALIDRAIPAGDRGDNLVMALVSLRVKFSPDEARAKLDTNLAMRRSSSRSPDRS